MTGFDKVMHSLVLCSSLCVVEAGWMARPYSNDLRRKLLEAHDQGKGTLAELADRFGVSLAWAWKISSARKRTGSVERKPYQAGPKVRVDRGAVRRLLEAKPDLYLRELQAELKASRGC